MKLKHAVFFAVSAASFPLISFADFVSDVESVRGRTYDTAAAFNTAVNDSNSYFGILLKSKSDTRKVSASADEIMKNVFSSVKSEAEIRSELKLLKDSLQTAASDVDNAVAVLNSAAAVFPLGNLRANQARDIADKTRFAVSGNPGDNFQDKKYFDSVANSFYNAYSRLENAQSEAARVAVLASVNKPRVDGINSTVAMIDDYVEKLGQANLKNSESAKTNETEAAKLFDEYASACDKYGTLFELGESARGKVLAAFLGLNKLMLNDIPASKKYAGEIFLNEGSYYLKPLLNRGGLLSDGFAAAKCKEEMGSIYANAPASNLEMRNRALAKDGALYAASAVAFSADKKNVRKEILDACSFISAAAAEMNRASSVVEQITASAQKSLLAISEIEGKSALILRDSIRLFASSQNTASDILLLNISIETLKAQNKIWQAEAGKLFNSAKEKFAESVGASAKIVSDVDALAKEIK